MGTSADKLIIAAEQILEKEGLRGVSAGAVAQQAGVNKALVFYHFDSVDGLVARVLRRYYARHKDALQSSLQLDGPVRERVHAFTDVYFDWMRKNRAYVRIVQEQVAGHGPHRPLVQEHLRELFAIAERALGALLPRDGPMSARQVQLSFSAMVINGLTYGPLLGPEALEDRRAHLHFTVDAWLDRLGQGFGLKSGEV